MKLAIVILNWNGKKLLKQFIPSIIQYSQYPNCKIYIVDNNSSDGSQEYITETFPTVELVQNKANLGFAKGYNYGLKKIDADVYALVNSDIEVTPNWLNPILNEFEENSNVAAIQPKILDYKQKDVFEYAGASGGFIDKYGYPFCRGRVFDTLEKDNGQYNNKQSIFWASGACFFIIKEIFEELNGFDEHYFAHQEEIDLCWRIQNKGYDVMCVPESKVYHVGGATLEETNPRKTFLNFRNSLLTMVKNSPSSKLFQSLFIRLSLDGIAGVRFLFQLKPLHTIAILKSHVSFYFYLLKYLKKRKNTIPKENYFYTKSIVYQYFIKNKKKFSDLQDR